MSLCALQEYKQKLARVTQVRKELKSHIQSLPDLSLLPNVTGGLAPLPSAGDLFSTEWGAAMRPGTPSSFFNSTLIHETCLAEDIRRESDSLQRLCKPALLFHHIHKDSAPPAWRRKKLRVWFCLFFTNWTLGNEPSGGGIDGAETGRTVGAGRRCLCRLAEKALEGECTIGNFAFAFFL